MVMYQEHFGLSRPPFSMHPDPAFLYLSEQHSSAKAFLESSALVNDSFVVITGSVGAGKTTLVEAFVSELPVNSTVIARINQTQLSATGFLRLLLDDLGLKAFKAKKAQLLARLGDFLETCDSEGKSVVVVVDEAQNLSREVLEEIRLLTGSQHAACLSVVLVGQPEFLQILESPNLRQLAQRCRLRSHLIELDETETQEYVAHRLAVAGAENEHLFSDRALELIFEKTGGVPRLINNLCDTALICAFADGLTAIDEDVVATALNELKWQPQPELKKRTTAGSRQNFLPGKQRAGKSRSNGGREKSIQDNDETKKLIGEKDARISELEYALELVNAESDANRDQLQQADSELSSLQKIGSETASETESQQKQLIASQQRLGELQEHIESFLEAREDEIPGDAASDAATLQEHLELLESQLCETETLLDAVEHAGSRDHQAVYAGDGKIADLHEQLTSEKFEQERLRTELDELKEKAKLVTDLEEKLARADSDLAALQAEKEDLGGHIEQSNEELEKEKARVSELLSELEAETGNFSSLKLEKERVDGEIRKSSAELEDTQQKLAELGSSLEAKDEEISALDKTEKDLSAELEDTRQRLAEAATSLEAKDEEISALNKTEKDLSAKLEDTQQKLAELGSSLEAKNEEISALNKTENELRAELENTRGELTASRNHVTELKESNEQRAARVVRLDEKVDSRDHSIRTLEAEVRRKNKLIDELHDKLKPLPEMSSQIETLIAESSELRNDLDSKAHRVVELEEALSLSQQRLDDARHEIDSSHNQHVDLHKEIAEHKSQVSELQTGTSQRDDLVKSLQVECQNRKQDLRRLRSELDESLDQARELRDSVNIGEDRARELEAEFQAAMETIREMNESGYEASTEAREVSVELTERQKQIESLEAQLQDKEATLLSMETTLKEKTETIKVLELDSEASGQHKQAGVDVEDAVAHDQLIKQLKREIEARDRCIDDLEGSLSSSSDSLAQFTNRMEQQDARISELEEQLESSRMAASDLREEVGRTDQEFDETAVLEEESTESNAMSMRLQTLGAGLLVSTNGHPARRVPLRSERLIIGRTRDSDIKIDNEFASRHHAQIVYDNGRFFVEDLNSTNGIYVNSRRVKRRRLRNRDIISIGRDRLIFVLEQQASH